MVTYQITVLPFRQTRKNGEMGQQEPHDVQQKEMLTAWSRRGKALHTWMGNKTLTHLGATCQESRSWWTRAECSINVSLQQSSQQPPGLPQEEDEVSGMKDVILVLCSAPDLIIWSAWPSAGFLSTGETRAWRSESSTDSQRCLRIWGVLRES